MPECESVVKISINKENLNDILDEYKSNTSPENWDYEDAKTYIMDRYKRFIVF